MRFVLFFILVFFKSIKFKLSRISFLIKEQVISTGTIVPFDKLEDIFSLYSLIGFFSSFLNNSPADKCLILKKFDKSVD